MNQIKTLPYEDMLLECVTCTKPFDYPATEQDYFAKHQLAPPKRCRHCREKKNQLHDKTPPAQPTYQNRQAMNVMGFNAPFRQALAQQPRSPSPQYSQLQEYDEPTPTVPAPSNRMIAQIKAENAKLREDLQALVSEVQSLKRMMSQAR